MFGMTLVALMTTALLNGATAPADQLGFYSMNTVVVDFDEQTDTVICVDFNGNEWSFEGIEDWAIGDYASLTMCDNSTEVVYDDIICDTTYCGWLEGDFGYYLGEKVLTIDYD